MMRIPAATRFACLCVAALALDAAIGTTTVEANADLTVAILDQRDPVFAGEEIDYTLTVGNDGPDSASEVSVVDTLAEGTSFVSASPGCAHEAGTVMCDLGTVASGEAPQVEITALAERGGLPVNAATVQSLTDDDPIQTNNGAVATTTVLPSADLSLVLRDTPDPVLVGSQFTYVLTVANGGPDEALEVTVEQALPAGTSFVSAPAGCAHNGGVVSCALGTVGAGASPTIEIAARADAAGAARGEAFVESPTHDADRSDNSAAAITTIESRLAPRPVGRPVRCRGVVATLRGTGKAETLKGTKRRDVIAGLGGDDKIMGMRGNDVLCGGSGDDQLFGGRGKDKLSGERGKDVLKGGPGRDSLSGGPGKDLQRR